MSYLKHVLHDDNAPMPRCQDLPEEAFANLDGDCMLVSISHGWSYQFHPDPHCKKYALLRMLIGRRRLVSKYPEANILVFVRLSLLESDAENERRADAL